MMLASRFVLSCIALASFALAACGTSSEDLGDLGAVGAPTSSSAPGSTAAPSNGSPKASNDAGKSNPPVAGDAGTDAARDATVPTTTPPNPPPGAADAGGPPVDPCANVTCASDEVCVPYAHGAPLGACVSTCDCSNCGNCGGDNADGRWSDMQEYCGNRAASPATIACNKPCAGAGIGCIPFGSTSICWPLEGCFSTTN
jgi:hypothetical protein